MASAEAKELYREFIMAVNSGNIRRVSSLYGELTSSGLINEFVDHTQRLIRDLYNETIAGHLRRVGDVAKGGRKHVRKPKKVSAYGNFLKKHYDKSLSLAENSKRISRMWNKK